MPDYLSQGSLATGNIPRAWYDAGDRWRKVYLDYLASIGAPSPYGNSGGSLDSFSDERCEALAAEYKRGVEILEKCGKGVLHAVNAFFVFGEPDELGDPKKTKERAEKGLCALAFGRWSS